MAERKPIHIAIIGGGIGGVILGIALSKFEHTIFTIFESRGAYGEIGAGVSFFANAPSAMRLIDPRIWDSYLKIAAFNSWESKQTVWFDFLCGEKGENEGKRIIEVQMDEAKGMSGSHRVHLLDALVKLLPSNVTEFNKKLVSIDQSREKIVCSFADGSERLVDLVVGCDGIRSTCRGLVFDDPNLVVPRFTKKVAYRGLIPMKIAEKALGKEHANNRIMYLGHGGHVLTFPVASGAIMNVVAFHDSITDTWEGEWVQQAQTENLLKPDIWAIFENPRVPTFHKGRICLLGDAAHAMSPHFGQGAGMAIEDSYILSALLGKCSSRIDVPRALTAYDFVRVPRASEVAAKSFENGKRMDFQGATSGDNLEVVAEELDTEPRRIWNMDIQAHLAEAVEIFQGLLNS
ncbi:FAD/NAD(P)-binding domain-containing protein [Thozetella sp. PMI_491]|nr:FAD/NAD(P)-binding domain-containing protein [Thozetella sp. PMI_491]